MQPWISLTGSVLPLDRANVDTDQIIPKQFLKTIGRAGLGKGLFFDWRHDKNFELNQPQYQGAQILIAGENFGCGSSREHAVWALKDYGFSCVVAPSFSDIFYNNCGKNGVLAIRLPTNEARSLMRARELTIDLKAQTIRHGGETLHFDIDPFRKQCLLQGWDDIALTLLHEADITRYEQNATAGAGVP